MGLLGALSAGLDIAGSIGGLFGKKKKGPDWHDQLAMSEQLIKRNMSATMQAASENGIHPLYALGAQPAGGLSFSAGGDDRESTMSRMADMGQNIGSALHRMATQEERQYARITAHQAVQRGALENELLKSQIAQIRSSLNPAQGGTAGQIIPGQTATTDSRYPSQSKLPVGVAGAQPRFLPMVNPDGSISMVTNPEAGDNEFVMLGDYLTTTLPQDIKNYFRRDRKAAKKRFAGTRSSLGREMTKFRK